MAAAYDEELTPDTDPPLIDPPPPATLLRRIFAHRRPARTVVEAPLVRTARPDAPAGSPAEPSRERPPDQPARSDSVAAAPAGGAGESAGPGDGAARPAAGDGARQGDGAAQPARGVGTRYCATCGDRTATAADGLHCARGHRLSPAHAKRRRRLLFWRR